LPPPADDLPPPADDLPPPAFDDNLAPPPADGGPAIVPEEPPMEEEEARSGSRIVKLASDQCGDLAAVKRVLKLKEGQHWGKNGVHAPVLYLVGDFAEADEEARARTEEIYRAAILRTAFHTDTVVVDAGQASGVIAGPRCDLSSRVFQLGICPAAGEENVSRNHSQHVVIEDKTNFGDEVDAKCALVKTVAGKCRVVCLVLNGMGDDARAKREIAACAKMGWPVLALAGFGGLADELAGTAPGTIPDWMPGAAGIGAVPADLDAAKIASFLRIHLAVNVFAM